MGGFADMSQKEVQARIDKVLAEYLADKYSQEFRIIRELKNGQLYCVSRKDGSHMILNDWRVKGKKQ